MKNTTEPQTIKINQPVLDERFDRASQIGKCMAQIITLKIMHTSLTSSEIEISLDEIYNQLDKIKL